MTLTEYPSTVSITYTPYQFGGVWRYACRRPTTSGVGVFYTAVGYCAQQDKTHPHYCGGHKLGHEAREHFKQYLLREQTRLHVDGRAWNPCVICWQPVDGKQVISPRSVKMMRWAILHVFSGKRRELLAQRLGMSIEVAVVVGRWVYHLCPRHQFRDWLERVLGDPAELME